MWTQFWDMHSGGGLKLKWQFIYIEAPIEEAKVIFYNRFKRNPERVSCTCCGDDYSISENAYLAQLTGFHRNCRSLETPRDKKTRLYKHPKSPYFKEHYYLEDGEEPKRPYKVSDRTPFGAYQTTAEYSKNKDVLIIPAKDIKKSERVGEVPEEGYVWQG